MFSARPVGLERFNPEYSLVNKYVRSKSLSRLTIIAVPAFAAIDIAYHSTALVLKTLRVVMVTVFRMKTPLKTGPKQHLTQVVNAVIAATTYPLVGLVSLQKVTSFHNYLSPQQNSWRTYQVVGSIGLVAAASLAWYAWPSAPPQRDMFSWMWAPVATGINMILGNAVATYVSSRQGQEEVETEPLERPRSLAARLAPYGSSIGAAAGLLVGLSYRSWTGVPSDYKLAKKMVPQSILNRGMQTMMKGPWKYVFPFPAVPVVAAVGRAGVRKWENRDTRAWEAFKEEVQPVFTRQAGRATASTALAVAAAVTQPHWAPVVSSVITECEDVSGHTVMGLTCASSQGLCIKATAEAGGGKATTLISNVMSVGLGAANCLFMYNTTLFHTPAEILAGGIVSNVAILLSSYLVPTHARVDGVAQSVADKGNGNQ